MKQGNLIAVAAIVIFVGAILVFINLSPKQKFDWNENYKHNNNQPYGSEILYNLLDKYLPESPVKLQNDILTKQALYTASFEHKTYFFIGSDQYINPTEANYLLDFVKRGNTVMVISSNPNFTLLESLIDTSITQMPKALLESFVSKDVKAQFTDSSALKSNEFSFHFQNIDEKETFDYTFFNPQYVAHNSAVVPLGTLQNTQVNFITAQVGKGRIFYHTNPLFFSNYHLIQKQGAKYAARVLSYLKPGEIIWDVYAQSWSPDANNNQHNASQPQSPLSFILGNAALKWALMVLLSAGILYMLFALKRIQRVVPIIEPKRNSSLAFIRTIGRLYFLEREHATMVRHQMRYFLSWMREKYRIQASELDEATIEKLHIRSGVPKEIIEDIRDQYKKVSVYAILDDAVAIKFHQAITRFYKHCK
jgi:hypothetical protein